MGMGIRGEIFSRAVQLDKRSYFFNVKENRFGDLYLNIVESRNKDSGGFDRQSIILFSEDLKEFLSGFDEALNVLEKANRDKNRKPVAKLSSSEKGPAGRQGGKTQRPRGRADGRPEGRPTGRTEGRPTGRAEGRPAGRTEGRPTGRTEDKRSPGAKAQRPRVRAVRKDSK